MSTFWRKYGRYMGHIQMCACAESCKKLQKIELFLTKSHFYAYFEHFLPKSWDIYGTYVQVHMSSCSFLFKKWMCKKLQFFSLFSGFTIQFVLESTEFMGHMRDHFKNRGVQKIAKNWTFFDNFNTNSIGNGQNMGHMREIWVAQKLQKIELFLRK